MADMRGVFRTKLVLGFLAGLSAGFLLATPAAASSMMTTGELTSQPIGHYEFCKVNPAECSIRPRDKGPERMNRNFLKKLSAINLSVNRTVEPQNDIDIYGKDEVWTYPDIGIGDCEDYVLEKRRLLMRSGVSLSNLLITVVRKPDGEGHAVLTVRTDNGDFILDNLSDAVKLWTETDYSYLKRQASTHTGRWVSLREENNLFVGAVKK